MRTGYIPVLLTFLLVLFLLITVISDLSAQDQSVAVGDPAPGIFLRDLHGQDFFLSDYCGKPRQPWKNKARCTVVLSFFATWCAPCMQEMPELGALAKEFGHVKFFLIDLKEEQNVVQDCVRQKGINLPVLLDRYGVAAKNYGVSTLPRLLVIDKQGVISFMQNGYDKNMPARLRAHLLKQE